MENIPEENQSECCTVVVVTHSVTTDLWDLRQYRKQMDAQFAENDMDNKKQKSVVSFLFQPPAKGNQTQSWGVILFWETGPELSALESKWSYFDICWKFKLGLIGESDSLHTHTHTHTHTPHTKTQQQQ